MAASFAEAVAAFGAFATLAVFLALRNPDQGQQQPIRVDTLLAGARQPAGRSLTESDVALFRGVLGASCIDLFWATAASVSQAAALDSASRRGKRSKPSYELPSAGADADADDGDGDALHLYMTLRLDAGTENDTQPLAKRRRAPRSRKIAEPAALVAGAIGRFSRELAARVPQHGDCASKLAEIARAGMPERPETLLLETTSRVSLSSAAAVLASLETSDFYAGQLLGAAAVTEPAQEASYKELPACIDSAVWAALGLARLYLHQEQAVEAAMQGRSVVVSTATASGKSVAYQAPLLQHLLDDCESTFLLVFPTKALAQDQLLALQRLLSLVPGLQDIKTGTFDGDTPLDARRIIRDSFSVVLTNPDALHASILPEAGKWQRFLRGLRMVVLDEIHVYRGAFGQHVAHIIARLQRLVLSDVVFVACSATACADPRGHMQQLANVADPLVVDTDGSARGARHLAAWKTRSLGSRPFSDTVLVAGHLLLSHRRTILFCKTRPACELLFIELQRYMETDPRLCVFRNKVANYRGGYTAQERRDIERALFAGDTSLVVTTSALELGINVGALDAVLMHGLPLSASSMRQQIGRAGRLMQDCLAIVMLTDDSMDRLAASNHAAIFRREPEHLSISAEESISRAHLQCAAFDRPLDPQCPSDQRFLEALHIDPASLPALLLWDPTPKRYLCRLEYKPWPAQRVSIRAAHDATDTWSVLLLPSLTLVEELDPIHALFSLYEGGVFLHRGRSFSIDKVDPDSRIALVSHANVSWYTRKRDYRQVQPVDTQAFDIVKPMGDVCYSYGRLQVVTKVFGYHRVDTLSKRIVETVDHASPALCTELPGVWIDVPLSICRQIAKEDHDVEASIHGAQHLLIKCISRLVNCQPEDLETECKSPMASRTRIPRLVVFERNPASISAADAGGGPTKRSLGHAAEILRAAWQLVDACGCAQDKAGCADCVALQPGCSENNQCIDKQGARLLLRGLVE
ncbi:ATP-dependent 3'-5' DNA helicase [Coemansia sp. IMI 203386]|nr:ATP-dependent 3'-5' DNA helicase [Coemansia sp. IMI 203386]